ncbi:type I DNA topoisomerase [uncultured Muribaculum sp.]|uniref:type I DNA topoisomerase n=2 Tax=uncultured Muribaculum sp. TaxID=1918613 RepID=UPI0025A95DBA|nr:type I DNA topoisomerase [uncultured Muribaculum sp.]
MAKNLVIVESPAKAKTIEKFLGKDYTVLSSYGHIRDLNKKKISIEIERDFSPVYEIPEDKKALVADLRKAAAAAQTVWLASDEDREGEAIAWHLCEVLGLDPATTRRIVFHEITKGAIENAIKNPRTIDLDRVDAQQARRVLDRIVGFELSPVLWKKIKPSLSAGRVQSVAVRLIAERETEIKAFNAEPYFRVTADFVTTGIKAHLTGVLSERLTDINAVSKFLSDCTNATYSVSSVQRKPLTRQPAPPFTTSTLQQEASRKLGMTVAQTMAVAQRLYESGHITYMRTDSLNLSETAIAAISKEITASIGAEYLKPRQYHTASKGAQEAHEAIRPTNIAIRDISASAQEKRLYNLIWKRTVASQMSDAQIEKTTIEILPSTRPEHFAATAEAIKFDGFLRLYTEGRDEPDEPGQPVTLPPLKKGDKLKAAIVTATERFTQQPPRYTEASLVKKMEELGIGRPSTYAPTISTIQAREYIEKGQNDGQPRNYRVVTLANGEISHSENTEICGGDKGRLIPTDIGIIVNNFLMEYFPAILDYDFTARMEEKFDLIAEGKLPWSGEIATFYKLFHPDVENAMSMRLEHKVGERILGSHPQTGKTVSVKIGRFGPLVQIGDADSDEKPQFASLLKNQSVSTITLDEALKLFEFPRSLGTYEGSDVTVAIGRFGPYVKHAGKFISIPKDIAPAEITIEQAEELIKAKRDAENKKVVKIFTEDPDLQILNGRYGIYIAYKKNNYKIPRTVENPAELSLEQCREIISQQDSKPQKTTRSRSSARK